MKNGILITTLTRGVALAALLVLCPTLTARAAVNVQTNPDGSAFTAVLFNGPSATKYDIVFIGDGFTASEQAAFNARVDDAVAALQALPPYSERMCAFNIWRVNVVSNQSGVDHPAQGIFRDTELDCRYGNPANNEAERCIGSDSPTDCYEAAGFAPDADAIFTLVNDTQWGGCAGDLVFSSISPGFDGIITHELGHKVGALADEYDCYVCDGSDNNLTYSGPEPGAVNLTADANRATTKWAGLIAATTALPTTVDSPPGVVGLWEGGGYNRFGMFRAQSQCQMRDLSPFCRVCADSMRSTLSAKCSPCEIDPNMLPCLKPFRPEDVLTCPPPCGLRFPIPPCLSCPFELNLEDLIRIEYGGLGDNFGARIVDDLGRVATEGKVVRGRMTIEFRGSRARQYFVELTGGARGLTGQRLNTRLFRNGKQQALR